MSLPLHSEMLQRAYDYLRATKPFEGWNLPEPEDLIFRVVRVTTHHGWFDVKNGKYEIAASSLSVGHTSTVMAIMAHEMIHLYQEMTGMTTPGVEHNEAFRQLAAKACKTHGFDPKLF